MFNLASGKKKTVNKRASKSQARHIFYRNSAERKVQYKNYRFPLASTLISNLLFAYDLADPPPPLHPSVSRFNINYAKISSIAFLREKVRQMPPLASRRGGIHCLWIFLAKLKLDDLILRPRA